MDSASDKTADTVSDSLETSWEYEHAKGKWIRYSDELSQKLNTNADGFLETEIEDSKLRLDINSMKQLNIDTGFQRNIRCTVRASKDEPFAFWEFKKGRRYEPFPRAQQIILEGGKDSDSTRLEMDDITWEVDFEAMEMTNEENKQKLRRTVSAAENSFSALPTLPASRTRALTKRTLNVDAMTDSQLDDEEEKDEEPKKKAKSGREKSRPKSTKENYDNGKRKLILKGRAPVDPECKEKLETAHVLEEGNVIWDAMLNQTNVANNNNKFYILQLLEDDGKKNFSVWFRWGRVGYRGQTSLSTFGGDVEKAKTCFTKKFFDKTSNEWADKDDFESHPRKYTLIHMDYNVKNNGDDEESSKSKDDDEEEDVPESKLDEKIQALLALICNLQAMEEAVMELEFDSTRSPLGKLTEKQIAEGYRILGDIEKLVKKKKFDKDFVNLVNEYYTKIPHNFGFQQPPLIKTVDAIKKETDLLSVLEDIEIAVREFDAARKGKERIAIVDKYYNNMHCDIESMTSDMDEYKMVERYMKTTHGDTHLYTMKITNLYKVDRHSEKERFRSDIGNKMLLWHGSRISNFYGILSQGLRIAPPEAPVCGYMFGKGIYFADMASKSGNYCYPGKNKPGLLILCEVALGEQRELLHADYDADKLPKGKHSTFGRGKTIPNPDQYFKLENDITVPCGKPTKYKDASNSALLYNEFIVYDVSQVRIRYLCEVEFDV